MKNNRPFVNILYSLSILIILFSVKGFADIRYVSKTGTSQFPYISWETASDSIQKCLDICDNGDTVYVGNGTYKETLIINKIISLIGSSMDSTIIDASQLAPIHSVEINSNSTINNFTILARGGDLGTAGIYTMTHNLSIKYCKIENAGHGARLFNSSSLVENCLLYYSLENLHDECPDDTCHGVYRNNIIISKNGDGSSVDVAYGGTPTVENNIVIEEGNQADGIYIDWHKGSKVRNNLVSGFRFEGIFIGSSHADIDYCINNTVLYSGYRTGDAVIYLAGGDNIKVKNNIMAKGYYGLHSYYPTRSDYNLFWNNTSSPTNGGAYLGDSNLVADPMFVNDTARPTSAMNFDYHLQAFSPGIHKGDPSILNKDGTRSDMGMYGGPLGETYTYKDLAPRPPVNLFAVVDSSTIVLNWNQNTESDLAYYKVYRDTVAGFIIDSTKLVSSPKTNQYIQSRSNKTAHYYYKLTAEDKQGNVSAPSEEILVSLTGITKDPVIISDYWLFQNYPNPFNPSTIISYRLKEKGYVKLMVYDIRGALIKVLVNETKDQGYYETEFNAKGLASGIYLYRIDVIGKGNIPVYTEMKKMILIK